MGTVARLPTGRSILVEGTVMMTWWLEPPIFGWRNDMKIMGNHGEIIANWHLFGKIMGKI
jgi:hypothetical protein